MQGSATPFHNGWQLRGMRTKETQMRKFMKMALGAVMMAGGAMIGASALSTPAQAQVSLSFGVNTPGYYGYYGYYGPQYRGCWDAWCGRRVYRPYYYGNYYGPDVWYRSGWNHRYDRRGHWDRRGHHRGHRR
jgi:hypothetical protein